MPMPAPEPTKAMDLIAAIQDFSQSDQDACGAWEIMAILFAMRRLEGELTTGKTADRFKV